jgi:hypothetical protein
LVTHQDERGDLGQPTEFSWFEGAQAGCQGSLQELMHRHDGLVRAVVRRQSLGGLPFGEALQAGRIGLWRAIVGFDTRRGLAFPTYAWPRIMPAVWRAVKTQPDLRPPAMWPPRRSWLNKPPCGKQSPGHCASYCTVCPTLWAKSCPTTTAWAASPCQLSPTRCASGPKPRARAPTAHRSPGLAAPPGPLPGPTYALAAPLLGRL